MGKSEVTLHINGLAYSALVDNATTLLQFIRDEAGLTGTKCGCEDGECGACTVLVDELPLRSCIILAAEAQNTQIVTVEGLAGDDALHPLQQAFIDHAAVQCGFCIPGMLVAAKALLQRHPRPTQEQVIEALGGHLCRCGGYQAMSDAVHTAAEALAKTEE